jgi:hypothetical protein
VNVPGLAARRHAFVNDGGCERSGLWRSDGWVGSYDEEHRGQWYRPEKTDGGETYSRRDSGPMRPGSSSGPPLSATGRGLLPSSPPAEVGKVEGGRGPTIVAGRFVRATRRQEG